VLVLRLLLLTAAAVFLTGTALRYDKPVTASSRLLSGLPATLSAATGCAVAKSRAAAGRTVAAAAAAAVMMAVLINSTVVSGLWHARCWMLGLHFP
jgi:hypothetical protein